MKYKPFSKVSSVDALAQCPKCLRTWTYDSLDALMDYGKQNVIGYQNSRYCPGCQVPAKLYQSLENNFTNGKK